MVDWQRFRMADTFGSPEEYFRQCVAKMAALRLQGLNAIRANPRCVGHSMTGTYDHGFSGEGITASEFRELKPGATDALFDGFAPLRLCLFVEPVNVYRGTKVRLDAVLANEDALRPGKYPVRLLVVGPDGRRLFEKTVTVTSPIRGAIPRSPRRSFTSRSPSMGRRASIASWPPSRRAARQPAETSSSTWPIRPTCRRWRPKSSVGATMPGSTAGWPSTASRPGRSRPIGRTPAR